MMIDAKGRANHTETSLKRYFPEQYANLESSIPEPAAPFTAAAHFTASALAGIPAVRYAPFDGDPESTLYVFFDFGCDHCRGLFQTLQADAIREALTQFRTALAVIPVAFSGTETAYKSSYALVKQPPIENLVTLFGHEAPLPSDITEAQIDLGAEQLVAIMGAVKEHKVSAVPRVVYVSANDVVEREGTLGQSELLSLITPPSAP